MLVIQSREDANDVLAKRINVIYSKFNGGLGEFFERLYREQRQNEARSTNVELDKVNLHIKEMATCSDRMDYCGND